MNRPAFAEGHQFFGDGTRGFRLGEGRGHAPVLDQAANEFASIALRCSEVRPSLAVRFKCRMNFLIRPLVSSFGASINPGSKFMPERKAEGGQLVLDLVERLLAEVAVLEHFLLGLHRQLADGGDVGVVQAIRRADAELDLVDAHVELLLELDLLFVLLVGGFFEFHRVLVVADKHIQ